MPRAILAMRTYPITILLAVLLFVATLIITTGSLGKVRSGGDGGDGGSGMGGTGKSGEFGGSGFGGTGGPSPFFTNLDTSKPDDTADANAAEQAAPVISIAQDPAPEQQPSANSALHNEIIDTIESSSMRTETQTEIAQGSADVDTPALSEPEPAPVQLVALPEAEVEIEAITPAPQPEPTLEPRRLAITPIEPAEEKTVIEQPQQLAETITVKLETETEEEAQARDRGELPDRIQRPEIPPFQRIRPIERPALLPPRVQPMRI